MRVHVFIATTLGPVRVQSIDRVRPSDTGPPMTSMVILDGLDVARFSHTYNEFVALVVRDLHGSGPWITSIERDIHSGDSWRLPMALAHVVAAQDTLELAQDAVAAGDWVLFATGELRRGGDIGAVGHVAEKIERARPEFASWRAAGAHVVALVPQDNADELPDAARTPESDFECHAVAEFADALRAAKPLAAALGAAKDAEAGARKVSTDGASDEAEGASPTNDARATQDAAPQDEDGEGGSDGIAADRIADDGIAHDRVADDGVVVDPAHGVVPVGVDTGDGRRLRRSVLAVAALLVMGLLAATTLWWPSSGPMAGADSVDGAGAPSAAEAGDDARPSTSFDAHVWKDLPSASALTLFAASAHGRGCSFGERARPLARRANAFGDVSLREHCALYLAHGGEVRESAWLSLAEQPARLAQTQVRDGAVVDLASGVPPGRYALVLRSWGGDTASFDQWLATLIEAAERAPSGQNPAWAMRREVFAAGWPLQLLTITVRP